MAPMPKKPRRTTKPILKELLTKLAERDAEIERLKRADEIHNEVYGASCGEVTRLTTIANDITTRLRLAEGLLGRYQVLFTEFSIGAEDNQDPEKPTEWFMPMYNDGHGLLSEIDNFLSNKLGSAESSTREDEGVRDSSATGIADASRVRAHADLAPTVSPEPTQPDSSGATTGRVGALHDVRCNACAEPVSCPRGHTDGLMDVGVPPEPSSEGEVCSHDWVQEDTPATIVCTKCKILFRVEPEPPPAKSGEVDVEKERDRFSRRKTTMRGGDLNGWGHRMLDALDAARKEIESLETDGDEVRHDLAESRDETADLQFELNKFTDQNHARHVKAKVLAHQCPECVLTMEKENADLRSKVAELEVDLGEAEKSAEMRCIKHAAYSSECPFCDAETSEAKAEANNTAVKAWEEVASSPGAVVLLREKVAELEGKLREAEDSPTVRALSNSPQYQATRRPAETAEAEAARLRERVEDWSIQAPHGSRCASRICGDCGGKGYTCCPPCDCYRAALTQPKDEAGS